MIKEVWKCCICGIEIGTGKIGGMEVNGKQYCDSYLHRQQGLRIWEQENQKRIYLDKWSWVKEH